MQRLDESFLLFSRDVVNFIVRGTAGGLLAFDGRATFAVNFAFWTHAMNLTIFDDRARIDSQQHFITDYMHVSQVDESLVRNGTYGLFCEQYIYAHHVRSGDIMRAAFETQRGNDDKNTVSDAAATKHGDVSPITPPRQVNYVFKTERFTSRLPNCTCYSLAVFVPPEMHALDYDTAWSNDKDPPI